MKPFPQRWAASDSGSEDETRARAPGNDFLGAEWKSYLGIRGARLPSHR